MAVLPTLHRRRHCHHFGSTGTMFRARRDAASATTCRRSPNGQSGCQTPVDHSRDPRYFLGIEVNLVCSPAFLAESDRHFTRLRRGADRQTDWSSSPPALDQHRALARSHSTLPQQLSVPVVPTSNGVIILTRNNNKMPSTITAGRRHVNECRPSTSGHARRTINPL
jgi:hypothetical protein